MTLTPGTEIGGYRIESLISQGGMGAVYRALQLSVDRTVAFKTLLHDGNPKAIERFKQEAKVVARISHPNVVQVLDLREENGVLFIAMELVEGTDLSTRLREVGPLDEATALDFMRQSAEALAAAHAKGVIHRDVKPSNIMLTAGNVVKVMDFGIAKSVVEETQITRAGALLGTPDYMPPEQISGEVADARSDVYALGATFYHLVAGRPPFVGKVYTDVLVAHKTETPRPLMDTARGVGRGFSDFIAQCLAKEPGARPASMTAVAEACRHLLHSDSAEPSGAGAAMDLLQPHHVREMALIEFLARSRRLGRHEVERALAIQREFHAKGEQKPLEDIMVEKKLLSADDIAKVERELRRLRVEQDNLVAFEILRKNTLLPEDKMAVLDKTMKRHEAPLLEFLEQKKWLAASALDKVRDLAGRHRLKAITHSLGQLLLEKKMITVERLDTYLADKEGPPLGRRLLDDGVVGADELKALLDVQKFKAMDHFFSLEVVTGEIRLRDRLQCPKCHSEVFQDDVMCINCKAQLKSRPETRSGLTAEEDKLEVVDDDETATSLKEWFVRTKTGDKGPYSLNDLMRLAGSGKIVEKHQLRHGMSGSWKTAAMTPKVARVLGLCHNCGNIRSKQPGACDVCLVDD